MTKKVIFYGLCACKYGLTDFTGWRSGRIWDSKPYVGGLNSTPGTVRDKMTEIGILRVVHSSKVVEYLTPNPKI